MKHPYLLHIFSPTRYVSPFDINMAYEANFDDVIPYCNIDLGEVHALTQDTIFSRSPEGVRRTGIFIGGREFELALDMLDAARNAMVPPFEVSVMADPSGAITTAAAMVALAESPLLTAGGNGLQGQRVCVFGGTGPVGTCVALLAAQAGAECVVVSHQGRGPALVVAEQLNKRFGVRVDGVDGSSEAAIRAWLPQMNVLLSAAKAGVQVVSSALLAEATALRIVADANAVPPAGIEGVAADDRASALALGNDREALAFGALAIGNVKYKVHTALLTNMYEAAEPVYLGFEAAYGMAQRIVG